MTRSGRQFEMRRKKWQFKLTRNTTGNFGSNEKAICQKCESNVTTRVCARCGGTGGYYYKSHYDSLLSLRTAGMMGKGEFRKCSSCQGSGRIYVCPLHGRVWKIDAVKQVIMRYLNDGHYFGMVCAEFLSVEVSINGSHDKRFVIKRYTSYLFI